MREILFNELACFFKRPKECVTPDSYRYGVALPFNWSITWTFSDLLCPPSSMYEALSKHYITLKNCSIFIYFFTLPAVTTPSCLPLNDLKWLYLTLQVKEKMEQDQGSYWSFIDQQQEDFCNTCIMDKSTIWWPLKWVIWHFAIHICPCGKKWRKKW